MGALTATESAIDVAVERDVCELVRRREAARRGRFERFIEGGVAAPIRAASWLSEGRRPPDEGRSIFGCSVPGCEVADEFALMAGSFVVAAAHKVSLDVRHSYLIICPTVSLYCTFSSNFATGLPIHSRGTDNSSTALIQVKLPYCTRLYV